mmetsp:Transcript_92561/g.193509  ORF Transcript_92561/g.193509 Transcript_92561/m.193509 type:complete len:215 (-) Transcript_92561:740-1384(-)
MRVFAARSRVSRSSVSASEYRGHCSWNLLTCLSSSSLSGSKAAALMACKDPSSSFPHPLSFITRARGASLMLSFLLASQAIPIFSVMYSAVPGASAMTCFINSAMSPNLSASVGSANASLKRTNMDSAICLTSFPAVQRSPQLYTHNRFPISIAFWRPTVVISPQATLFAVTPWIPSHRLRVSFFQKSIPVLNLSFLSTNWQNSGELQAFWLGM